MTTSSPPPRTDGERSLPERLGRTATGVLDRLPAPAGFRGMGSFGRDVAKQVTRDRALDFAASVAFRVILALFPLLLLTIAVLGMLGQTDAMASMIGTLGDSAAVPNPLVELLEEQFDSLRDRAPSSFTFGAISSLLLATWALSSAFRALMSGLNVMYGVDDPRATVRRIMHSLVMAVASVGMLLLATLLVAGGRGALARMLGMVEAGEQATWAWELLRWPVLALLVLMAVSLAYSLAPGDDRRFRLVTPGTLTAFALWLAFALGYSAWTDNFSDYGQIYGVLAGVAVLMLYVFWSAVILFVGAEVDHVRRKRQEEGVDA